MRRNTKGDMHQEPFMVILMIIGIFLLLLLFFNFFGTIKERHRSAIVQALADDIRGVTDLLSPKYGTVKGIRAEVPSDTDTVCFVDLNYTNYIIDETDLVEAYPSINASLRANDSNVFLFSNGVLTDAFNGGDICFSYDPYYSCVDTSDGNLDVLFEGNGGCVTPLVNLTNITHNFRNWSYYSGSPLFLIQEGNRVSNKVTNWREITSIVPLALFVQDSVTYRYNYTVVFKTTPLLAPDVSSLMIPSKYNANRSYVFNTTLSPSNSTHRYNPDPLKFWGSRESVVVVDRDTSTLAVLAALFAAYINSPLIYIDDSNYLAYSSYIIGKDVYMVVPTGGSLDSATKAYILSHADGKETVYEPALQSNSQFRRFTYLNSNITFS